MGDLWVRLFGSRGCVGNEYRDKPTRGEVTDEEARKEGFKDLASLIEKWPHYTGVHWDPEMNVQSKSLPSFFLNDNWVRLWFHR